MGSRNVGPHPYLVSTALLMAAGSPLLAQTQLLARAGVVLHGAEAWHVLDQCRGDKPDSTSALWEPSPIDIETLESRLGPLIQSGLDSAKRDRVGTVGDSAVRKWPTPDEFYRQYVGVVVGRRRLIYINGFHVAWFMMWGKRAVATHHDSTFASEKATFDWTHRSVNVCDGGLYFFGAMYDPADSAFNGFQFNGF